MKTIHQNIAHAFDQIGKKNGYNRLPSIGGILSTTFSHPVFAMPHMKQPLHIDGFNTAFRPTDNDEGTHLISFSQYYMCTNVPIKNQIEFIRKIILEVVKNTFPSDLQIEDLALEEGPYEWHADSTGYKGAGGEVNITSIKMAGGKINLGKLELAQINDYNTSGSFTGKSCHLIVFGIDRLVNLYTFAKTIKEKGSNYIPPMTIQQLYALNEKEASVYKGLVDVFSSTPRRSALIYKEINKELLRIKKKQKANDFSLDVFKHLSYACSFAECAYASNIITRDLRKYLIRNEAAFYKLFAKNIIDHPDIHFKLITQAINKGAKTSTIKRFSVNDVLSLSFFRDNFTFKPRVTEQTLHTELITPALYKVFWEDLGVKMPKAGQTLLPQYLLKQNMFIRVVGRDLAIPIEDLSNAKTNIYTLAGSISERLKRIALLLKYSKNILEKKLDNINTTKLISEIRYLSLDWKYHSIKIYPELEGILGEIALRQQGYESSLTERVRAFHTADKISVQEINDPNILLVVLVGKIDEAISLFLRNLETGKSIGSQDPFGIRQKIGIVTAISKRFKLKKDSIEQLFHKAIEINPEANKKRAIIMEGYLKKRIEQAMTE